MCQNHLSLFLKNEDSWVQSYITWASAEAQDLHFTSSPGDSYVHERVQTIPSISTRVEEQSIQVKPAGDCEPHPYGYLSLGGHFQSLASLKIQFCKYSCIICRFHICEFPYLLKVICNSQIHTCGPLRSFIDLCRTSKNLNGTRSQPRWKQVLPALFQLLWWEDHRVQVVRQGRAQGCRAGASWRGLESVLWHLLVMQPRASHLRLLNLWSSLSVSVSVFVCVSLNFVFIVMK